MDVIKFILLSEGFEAFYCSSPEEALVCLTHAKEWLVVTDYQFPRNVIPVPDFIEYARGVSPTLKLVLMSGRHDLKKCGEVLRADDTVAKPFDHRTLVRVIRALVNS